MEESRKRHINPFDRERLMKSPLIQAIMKRAEAKKAFHPTVINQKDEEVKKEEETSEENK